MRGPATRWQRHGVNHIAADIAADLYSQTLKATEARLLAAIAADYDGKFYKTDTSSHDKLSFSLWAYC
jgi:hypothetical protein